MRDVEVLGIAVRIGREPVNMWRSIMERPVLALELEQAGLKFADRAAFNQSDDF